MKGNYAGKSHAHKDKKKESKKNPKQVKGHRKHNISWKVEEAPGDRYVCTLAVDGQERIEWFNSLESAVEFGETAELLYALESRK